MKRKIPERIVKRADGFYWRGENGRAEHGPFPTQLDAVTDMQAAEDSEYEPEEAAEPAGTETGMANWIDPDTGEPGEEWVPRIEDH